MNQKDEGTWDDHGRDGGTNFILRIKEQETRLNLHEHDDDDYCIIAYCQACFTKQRLSIGRANSNSVLCEIRTELLPYTSHTAAPYQVRIHLVTRAN